MIRCNFGFVSFVSHYSLPTEVISTTEPNMQITKWEIRSFTVDLTLIVLLQLNLILFECLCCVHKQTKLKKISVRKIDIDIDNVNSSATALNSNFDSHFHWTIHSEREIKHENGVRRNSEIEEWKGFIQLATSKWRNISLDSISYRILRHSQSRPTNGTMENSFDKSRFTFESYFSIEKSFRNSQMLDLKIYNNLIFWFFWSTLVAAHHVPSVHYNDYDAYDQHYAYDPHAHAHQYGHY